jgi:hypothetical protein
LSNLEDRLSAPRVPIATVSDHNQLLEAIRRRIEALKLNHETVEYLAGLQSGYLSKIIANPPPKRVGPFTYFLILQALGLDMEFVENPQTMERLKSRYEKQKLARKNVRAKAGIIELTPELPCAPSEAWRTGKGALVQSLRHKSSGKLHALASAPRASEFYCLTPAATATVRDHHKIIWSTQFRPDSSFELLTQRVMGGRHEPGTLF